MNDPKEMPEEFTHDCEGYGFPSGECGSAIKCCYSTIDRPGEFHVSNGEYESRVNYCPYCGAKAPTQFSKGATPDEKATANG